MFFALFAHRRLVDDYELRERQCFLVYCTTPLCVRPPRYLFLDDEVVIFQALSCEDLLTN